MRLENEIMFEWFKDFENETLEEKEENKELRELFYGAPYKPAYINEKGVLMNDWNNTKNWGDPNVSDNALFILLPSKDKDIPTYRNKKLYTKYTTKYTFVRGDENNPYYLEYHIKYNDINAWVRVRQKGQYVMVKVK